MADRQLSNHDGQTAWIGTDTVSQTPVLIRSVSKAVLSEGLLSRLEREHALLKRLPPRISSDILELVEDGTSLNLVRGFAPGIPLGTKLRNGRCSIPDAISAVKKILNALMEIHRCGVVHGASPAGTTPNALNSSSLGIGR